MRVIKLSKDDEDMESRMDVDIYFREKLPSQNPPGQFLLTKGRISADGIEPKEPLVFSYLGDIVYLAEAGSKRVENVGEKSNHYPFYFCVDIATIRKGTGTLQEFELKIRADELTSKNIVRSQGWPRVDDSPASRRIWEQFIAE